MIQHCDKVDTSPVSSENFVNMEHDRPSSVSPPMDNDSNEASTAGEMQFPQEVKVGFAELCPVCGDKVSGYHYGLLTCESCKGFFKRTVQNKKVYSCVDNRSCSIDKSQRKRCPYCRFQKCLSVGMKLEAVRQDRMRGGRNKFGPMYKRDRALKQQAMRHQQQLLASCQMRMVNGITPIPPSEDIKPDPALLQQIAANANMAMYGMGLSPMSSMPSPSMPDSPPADYSRVSIPQPSSGSSSPTNSVYSSMSQHGHFNSSSSSSSVHLSHHGGMRNSYSPPASHVVHLGDHHNNNHNNLNHNNHHHHHDRHDRHGSHRGMHHQTGSTNHNHPQHPQHPQHQQLSPHINSHNQISPVSLVPPIIPIVPQYILDMKGCAADEEEIKAKLISFVLSEYGTQDIEGHPILLLQVLYKLSDQLLFLMVEWARSSVFFKELKVEDQMKLLQCSWSEILVLDLADRLVSNTWGGELSLGNGQKLSLDSLDKIGLSDAKDRIRDLVRKMKDLKIDKHEYLCLKYLTLLNPDVPGVEQRQLVEQSQEKVNGALMEYCVNFYPGVKDKFGQVLLRLPEVRLISDRLEEFLYYKHLSNEIPEQTLLIEMLHSKKK